MKLASLCIHIITAVVFSSMALVNNVYSFDGQNTVFSTVPQEIRTDIGAYLFQPILNDPEIKGLGEYNKQLAGLSIAVPPTKKKNKCTQFLNSLRFPGRIAPVEAISAVVMDSGNVYGKCGHAPYEYYFYEAENSVLYNQGQHLRLQQTRMAWACNSALSKRCIAILVCLLIAKGTIFLNRLVLLLYVKNEQVVIKLSKKILL